ncbi:hypothetical protein HLB35_00955 [Halomonas sp. TBZ9]|uniref:Uncharacterized protein n=1 Tax=Vreelandella azerica TaxID=2732867 RepID=A0A7Y3TVA6_9GAMM|nr:hypothetical protein [Halomonas azerica]NOG30695.1 hypothetical protein [Halomonas azerica]
MTYSYRKEYFWRHIIWPILWPCLLVQLALVLLCILVAAMIIGGKPPETLWLPLLGIMAILLLGSSLNLGAFIVLLRTKARRSEQAFEQTLGELEQHVGVLGSHCDRAGLAAVMNDDTWMRAHLLERLESVNRQLAVMRHSGYKVLPSVTHSGEDSRETLLDDLAHTRQQLNHLQLGRDRAREESRLKSGYLNLLRRETSLLFKYVDHWAAHTEGGSVEGGK